MSLTITSAIDSIVVERDRSATDYATGGYSLESWQPPSLPITVDLTESSTVDGAGTSGSRRKVVTVPVRVRVLGADLDPDDALAKAVALVRVVEADDGSGWLGDPSLVIVDQLTASTSRTFDCFRTNATVVVDQLALVQDGLVFVEFAPICREMTWALP